MTTNAKRAPRRAVRISLISAAALALLLVGSAGVFAYARTRPPQNQPDRFAEFTTIHDALQGEGEDAWPIYARFLQGPGNPLWDGSTVVTPMRVLEARAASAKNVARGDWNDPATEPARLWLRESLTMLDALRGVVDKPRFGVLPLAPTTPAQPGLLSPLWLSDGWRDLDKALMHIGEINSAAIRLDATEGRWDRVAERVALARALARHAGSLPTVRFAQTAFSIESGAIAEATRQVRERRPGADEIDAILRAAGEPIDAASLIDAAMHGETLVVLDTAHLLHTQGLSRPGILLAPPFEETLRRVESHLAATREWASASPALGVSPPQPAPSSGRRFGRSAILIEFLEDMHLPTFVRVARWQTTRLQSDRLALRIERFRAEHGRLPSTLDEAATREQALDPVSGAPFVYELSDDAQSYRLTLSAAAGAWMSGVDFTARDRPRRSDPLLDSAQEAGQEETP